MSLLNYWVVRLRHRQFLLARMYFDFAYFFLDVENTFLSIHHDVLLKSTEHNLIWSKTCVNSAFHCGAINIILSILKVRLANFYRTECEPFSPPLLPLFFVRSRGFETGHSPLTII